MRRRTGDARARPSTPLPQHPYRDSLVLHAVLALAVVGIAFATGGGLRRALVVACAYFVVATAWSWWRFRARLRSEER